MTHDENAETAAQKDAVPDGVNVAINSYASPIVFSESVVLRPRRVRTERKFKGVIAGTRALFWKTALTALEALEEAFFDEIEVIEDPGQKHTRHFAVALDSDDYGADLTLMEVDRIPPCVHHYEIMHPFVDRPADRSEGSGGLRDVE